MARLRTNSAFQRLTAAYASNEMGVTIAYILIPLVILDLTGSATNAGLVTALATTASTVAGIMSGAIADRSNPSFLLRLSFGLEFLLWGLLGLLLWQGTANVAIIAVLAIITSAVGAIDGPSEFVILKRIIPQTNSVRPPPSPKPAAPPLGSSARRSAAPCSPWADTSPSASNPSST